MTITTTALFLIIAAGLAVWFKKDPGFRKREFLAVSLFWILLVATPWGSQAVETVQNVIGSTAQATSNTVNDVSSK